jgi:predicted nucleic acid-binding protein
LYDHKHPERSLWGLTWEHTVPRHAPAEAAEAVRLLVEPPSAIVVLMGGIAVALRTLALAAKYQLTARRVHDARHAASALVAGITSVYTYDIEDWQVFEADGLHIVGPPTTLTHIAQRAQRLESRTGTTEGS